MPSFPVVLMVMLLAMDGIMQERNSALPVMMKWQVTWWFYITAGTTVFFFSNLFVICVKPRRIEDVT